MFINGLLVILKLFNIKKRSFNITTVNLLGVMQGKSEKIDLLIKKGFGELC